MPGSFCMHLFMGHILSSLHILKERIFVFIFILKLFFKFGFFPPHLLNFTQNFFCFSYFCRWRKLFLKHMLFIGGVVARHRGSCLYFYRAEFFCVLLVLYFLLSSVMYVYYLLFV